MWTRRFNFSVTPEYGYSSVYPFTFCPIVISYHVPRIVQPCRKLSGRTLGRCIDSDSTSKLYNVKLRIMLLSREKFTFGE